MIVVSPGGQSSGGTVQTSLVRRESRSIGDGWRSDRDGCFRHRRLPPFTSPLAPIITLRLGGIKRISGRPESGAHVVTPVVAKGLSGNVPDATVLDSDASDALNTATVRAHTLDLPPRPRGRRYRPHRGRDGWLAGMGPGWNGDRFSEDQAEVMKIRHHTSEGVQSKCQGRRSRRWSGTSRLVTGRRDRHHAGGFSHVTRRKPLLQASPP